MERIVKPKTQRGKRALEKKEPKIIENTKSTLFMKGGNTSQVVTQVLKDWHTLKKPDATIFSKKNVTRPFEDQSSVEFFTTKADCSLFMFGCHSKKRPNNIIIGRLFDGQMLDMAEFGVDKFLPMSEISGKKTSTGIKPCVVVTGDVFEDQETNRRVKNLLIDFFRGPTVEKVCLSGLEHVVSIQAVPGKVFVRSYRVLMKKSGSKTPRVELELMGPSMDLVARRTRFASDDLFKRALKKPLTAKPKKKKNVSRDALGNKLGRIHMKSQDFDKLQARKLKGLKRNIPVPETTESEQGQEKRQKLADDTET